MLKRLKDLGTPLSEMLFWTGVVYTVGVFVLTYISAQTSNNLFEINVADSIPIKCILEYYLLPIAWYFAKVVTLRVNFLSNSRPLWTSFV